MKRTIVVPVLLLGLTACAADGTPLGSTETASVPPPSATPATVTTANAAAPAPVTVVATTPVVTTPVVAAPAVTAAPVVAQPADPTKGEIILVEPVKPISQRGGNAALAIGATVLGAFIPGPWGSVASVATGQAGQYALSSAETKSVRYHIRMGDGTVETITQDDALPLTVGSPVQVLTLLDGSKRMVQTGVVLPPVASPATTL